MINLQRNKVTVICIIFLFSIISILSKPPEKKWTPIQKKYLKLKDPKKNLCENLPFLIKEFQNDKMIFFLEQSSLTYHTPGIKNFYGIIFTYKDQKNYMNFLSKKKQILFEAEIVPFINAQKSDYSDKIRKYNDRYRCYVNLRGKNLETIFRKSHGEGTYFHKNGLRGEFALEFGVHEDRTNKPEDETTSVDEDIFAEVPGATICLGLYGLDPDENPSLGICTQAGYVNKN